MRSQSREVRLVAKKNWGEIVRNNIVTIMFVVLCAVCMAFSGYTPSYVLYELFGRLSRNMFIVLALIIPIVAGMGINFAITIGAMAAQISVLWVIRNSFRTIRHSSLFRFFFIASDKRTYH